MMIGSKRLGALEETVRAIRQALDEHGARSDAADRGQDALRAQVDGLGETLETFRAALASIEARLDAAEADIRRCGEIEQTVGRLSETLAAEQVRGNALEQMLLKLERRGEAQAEEARVTATALLQRLEAATRHRPEAG